MDDVNSRTTWCSDDGPCDRHSDRRTRSTERSAEPATRSTSVIAAIFSLSLATSSVAYLVGCSGPVVKPDAFLDEAFEEGVLPEGLVENERGKERVVHVTTKWMETDSSSRLTFLRYRDPGGTETYGVVLTADSASDRLVVLPLEAGETPLDALDHSDRRAALSRIAVRHAAGAPCAEAIELSLAETIETRRLGVPIPIPARIIAVAASFPSHLEVDLGIAKEKHGAIARTPPRVFQKHPFVAPPEPGPATEYHFRGTIGPYDEIAYPERVALPADENRETQWTSTALDYEVELGIVLGRDLTWSDVKDASDEEVYDAVAGYVLVSDVKARNPQVFERALARDEKPGSWNEYYRTGDAEVDLLLGNWTETTCAWWSYAASLGDFAAIGPYFVATAGEARLPPRLLLAARTFAPELERGAPVPSGRSAGVHYLRQCSRVTTEERDEDALLWNVPAILRAIVAPGGALRFESEPRSLSRGDVVALGTPGGIALTVGNQAVYRMLGKVLFWWSAIDWHDAFFAKDRPLYLHNGDETFFWGEELGFQRLSVRVVPKSGASPEVDPDSTQRTTVGAMP